VRCTSLEDAATWSRQFPLIIADPPYIASEEVPRFADDPVLAIDGGSDGLGLARACLDAIAALLSPGGFALLQLGSASQVDAMAREVGPRLSFVEERRAGASRHVALFSRSAA
jgi:methylase of polypeptide subunit release factors